MLEKHRAILVMPDHIHGIVGISEEVQDICQKPPIRPALGYIMRVMKASASYHIHRQVSSAFAWQRGFYDRIVRNQTMLDQLRLYIADNPARWAEGKKNAGESSQS